jgi:DNA-directed RNA polymerase specialized sigma24 family protein
MPVTQPSRFTSKDWEDLWRRLILEAALLMSGLEVSVDCGVSAQDLVEETLDAFLQSPNALGWKQSKGSLPVFLGAVLKHRFLDHLRRDKKIVKQEGEPQEPISRPKVVSDPCEEIAARELQARLIGLLKGREDEKELTEFILAASMIEGAGKVNQQLAEILSTTVGEVINRRKRLWRLAGVKPLHEEFKHGRQTAKVKNEGTQAISRRSTSG